VSEALPICSLETGSFGLPSSEWILITYVLHWNRLVLNYTDRSGQPTPDYGVDVDLTNANHQRQLGGVLKQE
jgi:hypothetical protein